jgi:tRNA uridine 5-carbamoylmethylation protein Kti12
MDNIVVNFFGGPGAGKTTAAARLFASLKVNGVDSIMVGEYAQECILAEDTEALKDQLWMLAHAHRKIQAASKHSAVTIVDSPILLSIVYGENMPPSFNQLVLELNSKFHNFNVLIERVPSYQHSMVGRVHSLSESLLIDKEFEELLERYEVPFIRERDLDGDLTEFLTQQIIEYLDGEQSSDA